MTAWRLQIEAFFACASLVWRHIGRRASPFGGNTVMHAGGSAHKLRHRALLGLIAKEIV